MATQRTANVYITNATDGDATIQLFHQNDSNGTQSATFDNVAPGQTVGPLVVHFETGIGSWGILDWWSVIIDVASGSNPGRFQNTGTSAFPHWKECQLQSKDATQNMTFSVSASSFGINLVSGGCTDGMARLSQHSPITNVFVLMLENHSFDNLFGQSGIPGIITAAPGASNSYNGVSYPVAGGGPTSMPTDPGHEFADVLEQLAGEGATYTAGGAYPPIDNSGFAANYATTTSESTGLPTAAQIGDVMLGLNTATDLPVMYQLATEFVLCDQWFSSIPGPTWPNRMFIHGASSAGLDHSPKSTQIVAWESVAGFTFPKGSIFDALKNAGLTWRIYNDNTNAYSDDPQNGSVLGAVPQVSALKGVTLLDVQSLTHFAADLQGPYPYQYTFIEPNYGDVTGNTYRGGSSQHPMDDVAGGDGLVKAVYEAIRNSPLWNTSMLIVTYDEHGGLYDSAKPGPAVAPNDGASNQYNESGFTFNQLGVRVPALVISPLVGKGVVDHTIYDHSSVPATLERLFGFPALTARDAAANDVLGLLTGATPRTDAPTTLNVPAKAMVATAAPAIAAADNEDAADNEPIDRSGSLAGFLAIALKTQLESFAESPEDKATALAQFNAITTRGDARAFIAGVTSRVRRAQAAATR